MNKFTFAVTLAALLVACTPGKISTTITRMPRGAGIDAADSKARSSAFPVSTQSIEEDIMSTMSNVDDVRWLTRLATDPSFYEENVFKTCASKREDTENGITFFNFNKCQRQVNKIFVVVFSGRIKVCSKDLSQCSGGPANAGYTKVVEAGENFTLQTINARVGFSASAPVKQTQFIVRIKTVIDTAQAKSYEINVSRRAERSTITQASGSAGVGRNRGSMQQSNVRQESISFTMPKATFTVEGTKENAVWRLEARTPMVLTWDGSLNGTPRGSKEVRLSQNSAERLTFQKSCDNFEKLLGEVYLERIVNQQQEAGVVTITWQGFQPSNDLKSFKNLSWPGCDAPVQPQGAKTPEPALAPEVTTPTPTPTPTPQQPSSPASEDDSVRT